MKKTRWNVAVLALAALSTQSSCLSQNPSLPRRYFEPAHVAGKAGTPWTRPLIQLVQVSAPAHLGDRMAWRVSAVELAFDDTNLWVTKPEALIEHALRTAAAERGGLSPARHDLGEVLQVTVEAFEGGLDAPPAARIELQARYVTDNPDELQERTFHARAELEGTGPEALARGMGIALQRATNDVLDWVATL